jgi:signal transduction histidine kinase/ActR/RegA family two-component response regulator
MPQTPSSEVDTQGTLRLRRRITAAGIALIVLFVGADAYEAWQDYRTTIDSNQHVQVALSRALSLQTARMIQQVDVSLADSAGWMVSPDGRAAGERWMHERLQSQFIRLPFVRSAAIVGSDGRILASTSKDPPADPNLGNRESFSLPQRSRSDVPYIGRPFVGPEDGSRTFALSRRIDDTEHGFGGVVVARIAFDYPAEFYADIDIAPDTSIRLAREDGVTLVQYPADDASTPAKGPNSPATEQIVVKQPVAGYPVVIEVRRSASRVMQPWIQQELASAARTLPLAILASLLLIALRSALRRRDRMENERRRLEQELASAQRADALGFLAASVAHDFNNVLAAIVGYAELARNSVTNPALGLLDRLLRAAERARLLVRRILTFDTHRSVYAITVPITPIVEEVTNQIQATLPPSVQLEFIGADADATVRGDPTEVHQVLMNLCSNAVKAMPAGGKLELRMEASHIEEPRQVTIGKLRPGRWICVTIKDTGIGLQPQQIRSIFEPFYTTRQQGEGSGIGLTVVRNIILWMGGALEVSSQPGAGTSMSVYLPQAYDPTLPTLPAPSHGQGQTILVVDDEAELVALAEEVLASIGYEPVGFSDAREALKAFRRDPSHFDAVLTDERMVLMRGIDMAGAMHRINPRVPIILMTGNRSAELEASAGEAGIVEILDKPLRALTLQGSLGRWLKERDLSLHT